MSDTATLMPAEDAPVRATAALRRKPGRRQEGIALLMVLVSVVLLTAVLNEFSYNTRIELQLAANAQHELRAHYLAESAVQLGQAAMIVQQMIDRFGSQFGAAGIVRVDELVDLLLPIFNQKEAGGMLGSLLGVDPSQVKGLGIEGGSFDLKVSFEDGKLNLNCAGGLDQATDTPQKKAIGAVLVTLFSAPRQRLLFERPNSEGQIVAPVDLASALVDWVDVDEHRFLTAGGAEDYRYDARRDKYAARNYFIDTAEELRMAYGMTDDAWASFGDYFTVWGACGINIGAINPDHWPLVEAIIRTFAEPGDPVAMDERKLEALAQFVTPMLPFLASDTSEQRQGGGTGTGGAGGGSIVDQFVQLVQNPTQGMGAMASTSDGSQVQVEGVKLRTSDPASGVNLTHVIRGGRKTVFRLEASGESGPGCTDPKRGPCSRRRITAIFNTNKMAINSPQPRQGVWVYWREE